MGTSSCPNFIALYLTFYRSFHRAKFGCKYPLKPHSRIIIHSYLSWGKQFGQSWRVSPVLYAYNFSSHFSLSYRQQEISHRHGTPWLLSSTCESGRVILPCVVLTFARSNSFITQSTDFSGRNDLDMVCRTYPSSQASTHPVIILASTVRNSHWA